MALTDAHRNVPFTSLAPVVGSDDAVAAMLSHFPVREGDEPATKDLVQATAADLRTEIGNLRTEMHTEIGNLRTEMHTEIGNLRAEMHTEFGKVRTEMHTEIGNLRVEIADVRTEIHRSATAQLRWFVAINVSMASVLLYAIDRIVT